MTDMYGFPDIYIDKINLQNDESGNLLVDARLRLKISSEKDLFARRLERLNDIDRIKEKLDTLVQINIVQVTDENLFSVLTLSKELVHAAAFDKFGEINLPLFLKRTMERKGVINTDVLSMQSTIEINNSIRNSINNMIEVQEIKDISLSKDFDRYEENLETGERALNVYFNKRFVLQSSPRHLSYFIVADYREERLANFIDPEKRPEDIKVSAELVLNRNLIVSHTYSYFRENGEIWTGDLFQDPNGVWRAGKAGDYIEALNGRIEMPERLEQRVFYNNKIQDFRNIDNAAFLNINDKKTFLDARSTRQFEEIKRKTYIRPRNIHPIIFAGKTGDGVAFRIDPDRLLEKHSKFYGFLKSLGQSTSLSNFQIIRDVKIYRKRVQERTPFRTAGDSNLQQEVEDFTENEKPVYMENVTQSVNFSKKIISYKVVDQDLLNFNVGDYCYGIEIKFYDPYTIQFETKLQNLKNNLPNLIKYSNDATVLSFTREDGTFVEGHYDPELDEMTETFKEKYKVGTDIRTSIMDAANNFLDNLAFINATTFGREPTLKIYSMIRPGYANPNSILQFLKLYQDLIKEYEKIINELKPFTFYEEQIYFNKEVNVVNTSGQIRGLVNLQNASNLIEDDFYSDLKQISETFSLSIHRNEENVINSQVQRQEALLETEATQKFTADMKSFIDEARSISTKDSDLNKIKGVVEIYKKNVSRKSIVPQDVNDTFSVIRPVVNQEEIDKKQQRLTDISRNRDNSESVNVIDRSVEDTPSKEKTSNVTVSPSTLRELQQDATKKLGFGTK